MSAQNLGNRARIFGTKEHRTRRRLYTIPENEYPPRKRCRRRQMRAGGVPYVIE